MTDRRLIVFVKNPVPGTVKTRIARTVGDERAAQVYKHLLQYTQQVVRAVPDKAIVYYGDFINPADGWDSLEKQLQMGHDLGERMSNAFRDQFANGSGMQRVVIIGSDCLVITPAHIQRAFDALERTDVVIGPATDGGYYLLGMKHFYPFLFDNMPWSQPQLLEHTERAIKQNNLTLERLDELTDIDEWKDYEQALRTGTFRTTDQ